MRCKVCAERQAIHSADERGARCINANVATGQARPRNSDITPSIVASVTAHLHGKQYRVVRSADMMLRTSKKSKKRAPRREQNKY